MGSITGIPTTRISDIFVRTRLLSQVQSDQLQMFRTQMRLSTGKQFQTPSEEPIASLQVMSLQSLLERKDQVRDNVRTNQGFLSSTDVALSRISSVMADVRGTAISVLGTTATDTQRRAAADEVGEAIKQLMDSSNQSYRGRYLFAGSTTMIRPFVGGHGSTIQYNGNELHLASYGDVDLMFDTNVTGSEVFGAISTPVLGASTWEPVTARQTLLSDLQRGQGVTPASVDIHVGARRYTVDLSNAATLGDAADMIYQQTEGDVSAWVSSRGLILQGTEALAVKEVGSGHTAAELGILRLSQSATELDGEALHPVLRKTTPLADLLGARASARLTLPGLDNDLIVEAGRNGADLNGVEIRLVDDGSVITPHQDESVVYDPVASPKTLTIRIDDGTSTAQDVINAFAKYYAPDLMPFRASLDTLDDHLGGQGIVYATPAGQIAGQTSRGTGYDFDKSSGLQIVNGEATHIVQFADATTVEDLLNKLNGSGAGVVAEINAASTGVDVRSRVSGADFMIGENGGRTAADLGIRTLTGQTRLEELNFGRGVKLARDTINASALCEFAGPDSDLLFTAVNPGADWNGYTVEFVDATPQANKDSFFYDPIHKTLTFEVTPGITTANDVVRMFRANPVASAAFQVSLPPEGGIVNDGTGPVDVGKWTTSTATTAVVDFSIERKDGVAFQVDLSTAGTLADVLALINDHPDNGSSGSKVRAQLSAFGNGIELVDEGAGPGSLVVRASGRGMAAIDLGLIRAGQEQSDPPSTAEVGEASAHSLDPTGSLQFHAKTPGDWSDGITILFRNGAAEGVSYDDAKRQLTVDYQAGVTTAARVKTLVEQDPAAGAVFSVDYPTSFPVSDGSGFFLPVASQLQVATLVQEAPFASSNANSSIVVRAAVSGATAAGIEVHFVDAGAESVTYDPLGGVLTVEYDGGVTTAARIKEMLEQDPATCAVFSVSYPPSDPPSDGSGVFDPDDPDATMVAAVSQTINGRDVNPLETESLFTALVRLQHALETNELNESQRAIDLLDRTVMEMNFVRAEVGIRQQGLDVLSVRLEDEDTQLRGALSLEYDSDMIQVVSDLTAQQATYEASLRTMAQIYQLTLLNFL